MGECLLLRREFCQGLGDQAALAKLPVEERTACAKLWADVAGLLKRAEELAN